MILMKFGNVKRKSINPVTRSVLEATLKLLSSQIQVILIKIHNIDTLKLKEEAKILKLEVATRLSEAEIAEKDEIINDLRAEGEVLSEQVGKHSEVIKKLRSREKSSEKEIKSIKTKCCFQTFSMRSSDSGMSKCAQNVFSELKLSQRTTFMGDFRNFTVSEKCAF